ncbi:related to MUC1 Extracellular alpha-1,4-glucan glucosidase [Phialocephala subalpina]|uniref:Related to MUC1 Extracellular alpha-1,4-glucan glucosidase n=1 Tax=Phialocephala subalpina TaxID=576137 RepID=A0A1L7XD52_9HELO|nr:related to MUC1 Extracellular alpha-1,4-glucan glucosidase [Phialocephala subalpina]
MFGNKRRRAASNSALNGSNASASATTAAAQAFLKNRSSNASLSSAAAAAALRSLPTTPTSVADVQTKRTLRRAGSTSSVGSSVAGSTRGPPGAQLERRGSSGSMSERTFRDPSPMRQQPSQPVPSAPDAPPVPAIPKNIQQTPAIPAKSHRRAASLEAPAMRVASPPPNMANGRGSSLGPPGTAQTPPRRAGQRAPGLSSVQELTSLDRPASRGSVHSINFSYPTGSRSESPMVQRRLTSPAPSRQNPARIVSPTNQNLIYDPNTRSFLPEAQVLAIEQRLNDAANKPVKKKKRAVPGAGSHLSDGGMGARPRGTAIDAMEAAQAAKPTPQPVQQPAITPAPQPAPVVQAVPPPAPEPPISTAPPRRKKKKVVLSDSEDDQGSYAPDSSDTDSDVPQTFNTRAGALLVKKPSIVREDREREEQEDDTPGRTKITENLARLDTSPAAARQISPSPQPRSVAGRGHGRGQARASAAFAQGRANGRSASQPPLSPTESPTAEGMGLTTKDSVRGGRVHSVSPARTAHFATTPESLVVKHQPPARSISPRKSALKHSNSPRGPSPVEGQSVDVNGSEASGSVIGSVVSADELAVPKKKANRVSFDETNVVVGQAATPVSMDSPVVLSPQNKRPWYSLGRGKKKDASIVSDDDDEVMKPRPALPSFGSVRERKASKEVEERPLVKPADPAEVKLAPASPPLFTSPSGEAFEYPLGQSNDHVVGAVLAQDATTKNAANISKSREPLPPEVTSVEGSGYHSDTESSVYSLENDKSDIGVARANSVKRGPEDGHVDTYRAIANHEAAVVDDHANGNGKAVSDDPDEDEIPTPKADDIVPEIAILQATPTIDESNSKREWPDMPGAWESSTSDSGSNTQDETQTVAPQVIEPTPATVGVAEPSPVVHPPIPPQVPEIQAAGQPHPAIMEELEESDASVYSDAAEELTDTEGDGFMSLNAVVESPPAPINTNLTGIAISTPPDSPITKLTKEKAYKKNQLSRTDSEPEINAGWDKVQAYWSTLSADKKRQLELEAREEAEDSDSTIEAKPVPKPRKKVAVQPEPIVLPVARQTSVQSDRHYMIQPGAKAGPNGHTPMRSSLRARAEPASTAADPHIRKSMRGPGAMRGSLRGAPETVEPRGSLQKKYRPMSYPPPPEAKANPAAVNKHVRNLSEASAAAASGAAQRDLAPKPILRRKGSGDSESSFKRAKPSNKNEIPAFRRSMRASMEQEPVGRQASPNRSSRFSLRSLSPTGSAFRRPFNSGAAPPVPSAPTHMRNSLRNSTYDAPTLRNKAPGGFGRSGSAKQTKTKQKSRVSKSRFADSSDEDDDRPTFRSRFNDSSDEDEPTPLRTSMRPPPAPVRGIPKRAGVQDGDSSDLPDSDEEKPGSSALKLGKKRQNGTVATSNQGATLASGSLRRSGSGRETISQPPATIIPTRPNHNRRGSFMSILRRKKPDPSSKVRKSDAESPARRDTPLERSKSDLQQLRAERPTSPKLQKRRTISRENSASWPLAAPLSPPKGLGGENGRPFSADNGMGVVGGEKGINGNGVGINGDGRPDLGTRRFTATGLADVDLSHVTDLPGRKKKKFGKLRRMFRLDD